jgi:CubicO group peptidase (beta-lactamase class C family)
MLMLNDRSRPTAALIALACVLVACAPVPPAGTAASSSAGGALEAGTDASHAPRIARIESALLPPLRVRGRDYTPETIGARMAQLGVPAVSVAVISDGRLAWAKAWGVADIERATPATPETLFQAASMSKPVAAMAALSLVQEGRLTLDDDVNRWLRRWRVPPHEWEADSPVTLRRLLSHTAGLTVHGFPGYAPGMAVPSVEQLLAGRPPANTGAVTVSTRPGELWRYSGGGTTVVQLLVEEVSGVPFARFAKERVLDAVGMSASTYEQPLPAHFADRAATAYRARMTPVSGRYHTYPEMAAAGLWTTPSDLARWVLAVQRALDGDTTGVLRPDWARAMLVPELSGPHALGPQIEGEGAGRRFLHGGANAGFRGIFVGFTKRGDGAVIMTNADAGGALANELLLAIGAEYGWPDLVPVEVVPIAVAPDVLRGYAGRYGSAEQPLQVDVEVHGEGLIITAQNTRYEFVATGPDRFQPTAAAGPGAVDFERAADGSIVALSVAGLRLPRQ